MSEDAARDSYKITVAGPGIQAEREVDLTVAITVMQVMFGGVVPAAASRSTGSGLGANSPGHSVLSGERTQPLSIREFLEATGGRSIPAKISAVGRYMRDHEGQQDFSREEIKGRFRSAGEGMPGNFPRDFQKALQAGWIAEDPQNKGRFYVTRRGDEVIDQRFESSSSHQPRARRRRRASSGQASIERGAEQ